MSTIDRTKMWERIAGNTERYGTIVDHRRFDLYPIHFPGGDVHWHIGEVWGMSEQINDIAQINFEPSDDLVLAIIDAYIK